MVLNGPIGVFVAYNRVFNTIKLDKEIGIQCYLMVIRWKRTVHSFQLLQPDTIFYESNTTVIIM